MTGLEDNMSEEAISESDLEGSIDSEEECMENEEEEEDDDEDLEEDEEENDGDDEDDGLGEREYFVFIHNSLK